MDWELEQEQVSCAFCFILWHTPCFQRREKTFASNLETIF